jgi:hypothetical protein
MTGLLSRRKSLLRTFTWEAMNLRADRDVGNTTPAGMKNPSCWGVRAINARLELKVKIQHGVRAPKLNEGFNRRRLRLGQKSNLRRENGKQNLRAKPVTAMKIFTRS